MTDLSNWLTKAEAADRLGISERTLDRLCAGANGPERQTRRRPGKRPEVVFNPDDVAARQPKQPLHVVPSGSNVVARVPGGAGAALPTGLPPEFSLLALAAYERAVASAPELQPRPFLTLAEAADYSGLTETFLRKLVSEGKLSAVRDRSLKIRKASLDEFAGAALLAPEVRRAAG